ncbi:hypothetical protein K469DRAFT_719679 [Zopfia rhizophila CBS 207.26]|uniref:Uncharacterized protein n=1 Tax=Zopfia rhizophila CBS 207.26 TaxID=1314779 RepID=A0A6A6DDI8_9PEZI|nr:hypothetical protein K469DRAFT_719679 [Zopfia rhizophila CBS 207.26]
MSQQCAAGIVAQEKEPRQEARDGALRVLQEGKEGQSKEVAWYRKQHERNSLCVLRLPTEICTQMSGTQKGVQAKAETGVETEENLEQQTTKSQKGGVREQLRNDFQQKRSWMMTVDSEGVGVKMKGDEIRGGRYAGDEVLESRPKDTYTRF